MANSEKERQFQDAVAQELKTCVHFNGVIVNQECCAGVNFHGMLGTQTGCFRYLPCTGNPKSPVSCPKREFPTRKVAEQTIREEDAAVELLLVTIPAVKAHAKTNGLGKGSGGVGNLPCPSGCGGEVRYGVAAVNGHTMGRCSTDGCIQWRE